MIEYFLSYEQALAVKELGFDKPCFGYYSNSKEHMGEIWYEMSNKGQDYIPVGDVLAPLKQQFFKWVREKYGICLVIKPISSVDLSLGYNLIINELIYRAYTTYEKAEDACINELIEIIKNK